MDIYDIHTNHFPYRSHSAVSMRAGVAFKAVQAHERQERGIVQKGEVDIGNSEVRAKRTVPLMKVFTRIFSSIRAERDENPSDGTDQHYACRRAKIRQGKCTSEEDLLLGKLVVKYRRFPGPAIWNAISGRSNDDSPPLLRTAVSSSRRWIRLHPSPLCQTSRSTLRREVLAS